MTAKEVEELTVFQFAQYWRKSNSHISEYEAEDKQFKVVRLLEVMEADRGKS